MNRGHAVTPSVISGVTSRWGWRCIFELFLHGVCRTTGPARVGNSPPVGGSCGQRIGIAATVATARAVPSCHPHLGTAMLLSRVIYSLY